MKGLYIHIPFCRSKCDYCDFYSIKYDENTAKLYAAEVKRRLKNINEQFDTVYFGGGTPSVIGGEKIADILSAVNFSGDAEITVECNPNSADRDFFNAVAVAGVNRVSIGMQSAEPSELTFLTRRHNAADAAAAVKNARECGINNISLDLMLGLKNQTKQTLKRSADLCVTLGVNHISAYMLHIEDGTPMANIDRGILPDEDETAELYSYLCDYLAENGYIQYEISNFAKKGFESRHNLKYWNCDEYYGIGPAAHSFVGAKRYYFPRDFEYFINGGEMIYDCDGGSFEEYVMLRLRLRDGINLSELERRGFHLDREFIEKCRKFEQKGLMSTDNGSIRLTKNGFLVQNPILCELL